MTKNKGILIKNIYYMLSYAFKNLQQNNYESVAAEDFESVQDLFAAILYKGTAQQLKQGLHREYIPYNESLVFMRGKIDLPGTIQNRMQRKQRLVCEYDELSENNIYNQILKTTMFYLLQDAEVKKERKAQLKKLLLFFDSIDPLMPSEIQWSRLHFHRNNMNYEMLLNLCYLLLDGMLQTTDKGQYRLAAFSEESMASLYERFILEYYQQEHSYLTQAKAAKIKWDLSDEDIAENKGIRFLPEMQTDTFLQMNERMLIIDAKYYGKTLQNNYEKKTLHSSNLYQIFTYVKNQDKNNTGNVSGLLLYAKTEEDITPDCSYLLSGNKIGAKTLDLNTDFKTIRAQLDGIVKEYLCERELHV